MEPWPPNSPDLNPIENLWSIMDKKLENNGRPNNKEEFIETLKEVWNNLDWKVLENLSLSMEKRINLVIEREGESINGYF